MPEAPSETKTDFSPTNAKPLKTWAGPAMSKSNCRDCQAPARLGSAMVSEYPPGRVLETINVVPEGLTASPYAASPAGYCGPLGATILPPGRIEGPARLSTGRTPAGAA